MFTRLIATLFNTATRTPIRNANRFRPRVEGLEAREVPAGFGWMGSVNTDAQNPDNWSSLTPGALPGSSDEVYFGPVGSDEFAASKTASCTNFGQAGQYLSVNLAAVYSGTITLSAGFTTPTFMMQSGTISQPVSGTDITVTQNFGWTKGTINSSSHLSDLTLDGATGLIAPYAAGTVTLGSNLSVVNATVLNIYAGTISCINEGMTFTVADQGGIRIDPGAGNRTDIRVVAEVQNKVVTSLGIGGYIELRSGQAFLGGDVINALGGRVTLMTNTTLEISGRQGNPESYFQDNFGDLFLHGESKLKSPGKQITIKGGKLATVASGSNSSATIEATLLAVRGGDVVIGDGSLHTFGTLTVQGAVDWSDGTFRPIVQDLGGGVAWQSDVWRSTGVFTIRDNATLAAAAIDFLHTPVMPSSGSQWLIIESLAVIANPNGAPSYNTAIWDIVKDGNPVKKWYLKAV